MQSHYHDHHISPPPVDCPDAAVPSELDEYLFDLQGFVVLRGVLSKEEVDACNACVDRIPRSVPRNGWHGRIHREDHPEHRGISYQQIYEAGAPFEKLIDHPGYINYAFRFVGGDAYDRLQGPMFIDENFFNIRGPGESIPIHSGGHELCKRIKYDYHNGRFASGQLNLLFAFNDIGPGDGATMVIPGSHKSNLFHPEFKRHREKNAWSDEGGGASLDGIPGAVEVHMKAGDGIVFVDATCHGSARRVNPGERRIAVFRYGSAWNRSRFGYEPSAELMERLNPFARSIVSPGKRLVPE
ncbi:MAG: phytanoyl-CoA dioxygenase family protein [Terrimicrobiaceae bacterium]|nr:phytanoyl-CoA dioxygenase family protein [Terrimicrobiaceae bacterium]